MRTMQAGGVVVVACLVPGLSAGCTNVTQTFPGRSADQVWTALVAVANEPRYDDWAVAANEAWVDESQRRIEIFRHLRRVLYAPGTGSEPRPENRTWRFEVRLVGDDPPEATFRSRGFAVPAHAGEEAVRYFADVRELLTSPPGETAVEPSDQDLLDALGLDEE